MRDTIEEQWRPIEGYERLYEVSNLGRVKSLERIDNNNHLVKERILKFKIDKDGYLQVGLCKEGKRKYFRVHRLVAQTFIPNPEGLPQINHRDEDKTNNVVFLKDDGSVDECRSNLEWCTARYNTNYGTRIERVVQTRIRNRNNSGKINERERLRYQKNREKRLEYARLRYQENREKRLEYARLRYQENRDQINERRRERYQRLKKKDNRPSGESLW